MSAARSVVISAAGMGTRLGLNSPKCLVEVAGKPLLQHQLELMDGSIEVIVVVGYEGQRVVSLIRDVRPTTIVAFNHEFASTGTAASASKGSLVASDDVVLLDGDLLVDTADFMDFLDGPRKCLGLTTTRSANPVCARLDASGGLVVELSQEWHTPWEWSGLVKLPRTEATRIGTKHVFQGLSKFLPMTHQTIDCVEIDYPEDLELAETWLLKRKGQK